jgi:FlaG/FlaF family flagellin (archaellin)
MKMKKISSYKSKLNNSEAVSPVVGVMLMLVVTIIIAAVVSGFAGSIVSTESQAPTLSASAFLELTGDKDSRFSLTVDSVSEPIPTSDLKIITFWKKEVDGTMITGGNTTTPGNFYNTYKTYYEEQPFGFGPGVENWVAYGTRDPSMQYGNYTLEAGTAMIASPYRDGRSNTSDTGVGYGPRFWYDDNGVLTETTGEWYVYGSGTAYTYGEQCDGMQGFLGYNWNVTRPGDAINVKLIHIPSGKTIFDKNIVATGRTL